MTNPTNTNAKAPTSKAPPKKAAPKKPEGTATTDDKTGQLLQLIARGWGAELRAIAAVAPTSAKDIQDMRRRVQRLAEVMRETEKAVEA